MSYEDAMERAKWAACGSSLVLAATVSLPSASSSRSLGRGGCGQRRGGCMAAYGQALRPEDSDA